MSWSPCRLWTVPSYARYRRRDLTIRVGLTPSFRTPWAPSSNPVLVPLDLFVQVCRHFEGDLTLDEIRARVHAQTGQVIPPLVLERLVEELDTAMVLDGPTFASFQELFRGEAERPAALAGRSYAAGEETLRQQLSRYFAGTGGAGPPALCAPAPIRPLDEFAGSSVHTSTLTAAGRFTRGRTRSLRKTPASTRSSSWEWPINTAGAASH